MFSQKWAPFLSYPKSDIFLNESGIGLPSIQVKTNKSFMANLNGPGIINNYNNDQGHSGWISHPYTKVTSDGNSEVQLLDRDFQTYQIDSVYKYRNEIYKEKFTVIENKVIAKVEIPLGIFSPLTLNGLTLGQCSICAYKNGIEVTETYKDYKPMMYRILVRAWSEYSEKKYQIDPLINVDGNKKTGYQHYDCRTDYSFVFPKGTDCIELILEYSRDGFEYTAGCIPNSLQEDNITNSLIDMYAADIEKYFELSKKNWELFEQSLPQFELPDKRMKDFLDFTFVNQIMCEIKSDGLISYPTIMPKQTFWGFWMWDYCFQSVASRWIKGRRLSKGALLNMANMQWDNGCITNSAGSNGVDVFLEEHGSYRRRCGINEIPEDAIGGTHPPSLGLAFQKMLDIEGNIDFISRILPTLVKYTEWFEDNRISDRYSDLIVVKKWSDSGQDNSKRWGKKILTEFGTQEKCWWDFPIIPVDVNVLWSQQNGVLGLIYEKLGEIDKSKKYLSRAKRITELINSTMWDEEAGFYFDIHEESGKRIPVYTPAGFVPLYNGTASIYQYERLKKYLLDKKKFWTKYPIPTLAADDEDFNPANSYWRGTVWFNFNYLIVEGLFNYDTDTALKLLDKTIDLMTHKGFVTSYENYNPITGDGYNAAHFLWNGMISSTIIERLCGIQPKEGVLNINTKNVPEIWKSFLVSNIPIFNTTIGIDYENQSGRMKIKISNTGKADIKVRLGEAEYVVANGSELSIGSLINK